SVSFASFQQDILEGNTYSTSRSRSSPAAPTSTSTTLSTNRNSLSTTRSARITTYNTLSMTNNSRSTTRNALITLAGPSTISAVPTVLIILIILNVQRATVLAVRIIVMGGTLLGSPDIVTGPPTICRDNGVREAP
ncbi:hypothetical protein Q9L58_009949, partial [Maublancomyces gigas]